MIASRLTREGGTTILGNEDDLAGIMTIDASNGQVHDIGHKVRQISPFVQADLSRFAELMLSASCVIKMVGRLNGAARYGHIPSQHNFGTGVLPSAPIWLGQKLSGRLRMILAVSPA